MGDYLDVIEQFRRLAPDVQRDLAERFDLFGSADTPNAWLLRAHQKNIMDEFGKAVQEAPQ